MIARRVERQDDDAAPSRVAARRDYIRSNDLTRAWIRWAERREFYPHLAAMPVFAGCSRRVIWRIARWGDIVSVRSGDVLAREDRSNLWFFVILSGSVKVTHGRRQVVTLQRGGHFGEIANLGFRPQAATVTALEPTVLFVLSRRHFVSLVASDVSIQRALFPDVSADRYRAFVRELHEEGRLEWERLRPDFDPASDIWFEEEDHRKRPGKQLTWADAVDTLTSHDQRPGASTETTLLAPVRTMPTARLVAITALVVGIFVVAIGALYHPPLAIVTPSRPIDVVRDITITGAPIDRPTGRYLLTAVDVDRPNVARTVLAWALGRTVVSVRSDGTTDVDDEERAEHDAFLHSHREAIRLAKRSVDVADSGLTIVIRDRGIGGPSAGLIYALAIIDMLDPTDLANGSDIAATGELTSNGRVHPVGFVAVKADVVRNGAGDVFIVPHPQSAAARHASVPVVGVKTLADAVDALRERAD